MTMRRAVPSLVIALLVTLALASVAATVVGLRRDPAPQVAGAFDPLSVAEPRPEVEAAEVLAAWDADRAAAWASGDVRRLRSLYAAGSVAGAHDVAMLRHWLERGLVVTGLRTQVLSLREVRRTPDRWILVVTDRVVDGVAVGPRGTVALPSDTATVRRLALRRLDDRWVVASVGELRTSRQAR